MFSVTSEVSLIKKHSQVAGLKNHICTFLPCLSLPDNGCTGLFSILFFFFGNVLSNPFFVMSPSHGPLQIFPSQHPDTPVRWSIHAWCRILWFIELPNHRFISEPVQLIHPNFYFIGMSLPSSPDTNLYWEVERAEHQFTDLVDGTMRLSPAKFAPTKIFTYFLFVRRHVLYLYVVFFVLFHIIIRKWITWI